ncbi:MAG: hypothetical protein V4487_00270 [Chlamydiota bacterium]
MPRLNPVYSEPRINFSSDPLFPIAEMNNKHITIANITKISLHFYRGSQSANLSVAYARPGQNEENIEKIVFNSTEKTIEFAKMLFKIKANISLSHITDSAPQAASIATVVNPEILKNYFESTVEKSHLSAISSIGNSVNEQLDWLDKTEIPDLITKNKNYQNFTTTLRACSEALRTIKSLDKIPFKLLRYDLSLLLDDLEPLKKPSNISIIDSQNWDLLLTKLPSLLKILPGEEFAEKT